MESEEGAQAVGLGKSVAGAWERLNMGLGKVDQGLGRRGGVAWENVCFIGHVVW